MTRTSRTLLRLAAPLSLVGLGFAGLVGCTNYEEEENFIERAAKETCDLERKCYFAGYVDAYSDHADCIDDNIDDFEDELDFFDDIGCDYEPDNAPDCIDALKQAGKTCEENDLEDIVDACYEDLFDC